MGFSILPLLALVYFLSYFLARYIKNRRRARSNPAASFQERGIAYLNGGNNDLALAEFTKAINSNPEYSDPYFYRANAYIN